jgi:general secretion pathway protein A
VKETFYGPFYRLDSPPFHITPDPALFFATQTHQQALGAVEYGVTAGKGFIVVTGEVGVGKTTVLRTILDGLPRDKTTILYLFNPNLSVANLYGTILEGLDSGARASADPAEAVQQLHEALLDTNQRGIDVILAVDEAQNMPEATLESLRVLSNLETATSKLLQIILVGQPELDAMLKKHGLRQLAQRVAVRAQIAPLTLRQSCRYVQHRLICAGRPNEPPLFTVPALWYLAWVSRGIPRTLNICADNALINGYGHRADRISLKLVREAVRSLQLRSPLARRAAALAVVALLALTVAGFVIPWRQLRVPAQEPAPIARSAAPAAEPAPPVVAASAPAAAADAGESAAAAAPAPLPAAPPAAPLLASAAAAAPAPAATGPVATPLQEPPRAAPPQADPAADLAAPRPATRRWLVQHGDTLTRACLETYRRCDLAQLREIFAYNPKIDAKGTIRPGDVIVLPTQPDAPKPN